MRACGTGERSRILPHATARRLTEGTGRLRGSRTTPSALATVHHVKTKLRSSPQPDTRLQTFALRTQRSSVVDPFVQTTSCRVADGVAFAKRVDGPEPPATPLAA